MAALDCAILDDYQGAALQYADWSVLEGRVRPRVYREHFASEDQLVATIRDCPIVVAMRERTRFGASLFARLPNLKLLVSTGGRNAAIDLAAAKAAGVPVAYTPSYLHGTMELTWALILAAARNLPNEVANFRAGGPWQLSVGADLAGHTLGIIGLGRQGTAVARVAKAFDMRVIAWSQNLTAERCREHGVELAASRDALLAASDFVTIHLVLSDRTRDLIDCKALACMRRTAWLINTSSGPIVNHAALVEALRHEHIAGAALDVYDQEPVPPDDPLRQLDNLVATPHLGYVTEGAYRAYFGGVVENIAAWLDGKLTRLLGQ